jgi:hypothetical protein
MPWGRRGAMPSHVVINFRIPRESTVPNTPA